MRYPPRSILVIGASGFVGQHLSRHLRAHLGDADRIVATARMPRFGEIPLDLTDGDAVRALLKQERPTHVVNLAGISSPAAVENKVAEAWDIHASAVEALGRIILEEIPETWLLHASSGLVYGRTANNGPVSEEDILAPLDMYAVTKASGDLALEVLAGRGLRCLRLRPFNHTGPGHSETFAIPSFASQIARIEAGLQARVLRVGNLEAARDFLDVRDVVSAYTKVIEASDWLKPGRIFNVASGQARPIREFVDILISESRVDVKVEPQEHLLARKSEVPKLIGDASALRDAVNWAPEYDTVEMLRSVLDYHRKALNERVG